MPHHPLPRGGQGSQWMVHNPNKLSNVYYNHLFEWWWTLIMSLLSGDGIPVLLDQCKECQYWQKLYNTNNGGYAFFQLIFRAQLHQILLTGSGLGLIYVWKSNINIPFHFLWRLRLKNS